MLMLVWLWRGELQQFCLFLLDSLVLTHISPGCHSRSCFPLLVIIISGSHMMPNRWSVSDVLLLILLIILFFFVFFFLFFFLFLLLLTAVCDVDVNISNQVAVIQLSTLLLLLFLLLVVLLQLPPFVVVLVSGCCCPKRPVLRQQCFKMALPESRGNKTTEGKTQRFPDSSMLTLSLEENPIKNLTRPNVLDHGETMSTCLSEREATVPSCSHIWPCFLGTSLIHCFEAKHRKPCNWRCPILANQSESLKLRGKPSIREVALHTILHTTKNMLPCTNRVVCMSATFTQTMTHVNKDARHGYHGF